MIEITPDKGICIVCADDPDVSTYLHHVTVGQPRHTTSLRICQDCARALAGDLAIAIVRRNRELEAGVAQHVEVAPAQFYIADTRAAIGNCVSWWGPDRGGYTTELVKAGRYTREEATGIMHNRSSDRAYRCEEVEALSRVHVEMHSLHDLEPLDFKDV